MVSSKDLWGTLATASSFPLLAIGLPHEHCSLKWASLVKYCHVAQPWALVVFGQMLDNPFGSTNVFEYQLRKKSCAGHKAAQDK